MADIPVGLQNDTDRRRFLLGAAVLPLATSGVAAAAEIVPAPSESLAFAFIKKRPDLSANQLRERYEGGHVPGALRVMVPMGLRHYVRNYVQRSIGLAPDFDVISEFGFKSGSTGPNVCGRPIDPNWVRNRSTPVIEHRLFGTARTVDRLPVRKRAFLLRRPATTSPEEFSRAAMEFAKTSARQLSSLADRVTFYRMSGNMREVHECVDTAHVAEAILMIWPRSGATLPESLPAPETLALTSILDLEAVRSIIAPNAGSIRTKG